CTRRSFDYW
nr:immunoglobulin heavy chain junction region [Mus musculus]